MDFRTKYIKSATVFASNRQFLTEEVRTEDDLRDPKFGDSGDDKCTKCSEESACPGHPGHILLKYKIFHPLYISTTTKLLAQICNTCGEFLSVGTSESDSGSDSDTEYVQQTVHSLRVCRICDSRIADRVRFCQSKDDRSDRHSIEIVSGKTLNCIGPDEAEGMIESVIDSVREYLKDPQFEVSRIVVNSITVSPPVSRPCGMEGGKEVVDVTTVQYGSLLLSIRNLENCESSEKYRAKIFARYQTLLGLTTPSDSANKYLKQRVSGKEGHFRKFCLAKRMNYCGRSVISPDPTIDLDEIGIPTSIAKCMEVKDGELILANRQPSLQRTSLLAMKAKVISESKTLRLNPGVITPFNADFDGDEMSVYAIRGEEERQEAEALCSVRANIIGFKDSSLNFGPGQDTMTGLHVLSLEDTIVDRKWISPRVWRVTRKSDGRSFISSLLPEDFDYECNGIVISGGIYSTGTITKSAFWTGKTSLLRAYLIAYGDRKFVKFISEIQKKVCEWISTWGLTVSLWHCVGANNPKVDADATEMDLISVKTKSEEIALEVCHRRESEEKKRVGLIRMVSGGTKGDRNNVGQIMSCVGQQNVFGRPPERKLPHFRNRDDGPEARGFVRSSYLTGLKPHEMFYHSQMGREGIVRTGISTADTGYSQRMIVKFAEGLTVREDGTVRDVDGTIVRFKYGADGLDPSKVADAAELTSVSFLKSLVKGKSANF
jgi:DNA-directed RNA polymerase beta' subunit